ncbi:LSB6 [Candida jiufengensis]|uniref:LSB6 n=1 Tax=Candida jiufengensis TaxID=497108 RepID=UPI0022250AC5|nr:LSB6 [Candida jiufengensis]KAI5953715.1 LSB6 [Candida jiufengensis]
MVKKNSNGIDKDNTMDHSSHNLETLSNPFESIDSLDRPIGTQSPKSNSSLASTPLNPTPKPIIRSKSTPSTPHQLNLPQNTARRTSLNENLLLENHMLNNEEHTTNFRKFKKAILIPAAKWAISPIKMHRNSKIGPPEEIYRIEYSVFKPSINTKQLTTSNDISNHFKGEVESATGKPFQFPENYINHLKFNKIVENIKKLIEVDHIYPERISVGSSGSYFVFNKIELDNVIAIEKIGVFKPKSEEPYGPLSPKWTKWLHRTFFPCFFGRSCLIPNLGYISEAAASVLDQQLQSYIVPYTDIIELRAPTFYYSFWDKSNDVTKLPYKIGSLQLFLKGYTNADIWFKMYPLPTDIYLLPKSSEVEVDSNVVDYTLQWSRDLMLQFQEELEKMVILDYLMRNTDRGSDNWMIKIEWEEIAKSDKTKKMKPILKIGAIDSGLAFPWKHPNEWRSFPYGWLFLPLSIIGQPFTKKTRDHYLPLLTSKLWWEVTVTNLKKVFMKDQDFKERMWLKQLAVLKGQAFNIVEVLKLDYAGPLELTRREKLLVFDDIMYMPQNEDYKKLVMFSSNYANDIRNGQSLISQNNESDITPLLPQPQHQLQAIDEIEYEPYESGYERINKQLQSPENRGTKVVIERIVKEQSRPPVFTWC